LPMGTLPGTHDPAYVTFLFICCKDVLKYMG
jgi:hypothetical protein